MNSKRGRPPLGPEDKRKPLFCMIHPKTRTIITRMRRLGIEGEDDISEGRFIDLAVAAYVRRVAE